GGRGGRVRLWRWWDDTVWNFDDLKWFYTAVFGFDSGDSVHMILNTALYLDCNSATNAETIFFYLMQLGCGFVIIYRGTHLIHNPKYLLYARIFLTFLLCVIIGVNLAGDILRTMIVVDGVCIPMYDRFLGNVSKSMLAILYFILLFAFTVPVYQRLRGAKGFVDTSTVQAVALWASVKIMFAIVVMLVTVICSFFGVFGAYFWMQFTV
ncbi:hypothetical protein HK102_004023, partial [Quaeritorhiza haematococci]